MKKFPQKVKTLETRISLFLRTKKKSLGLDKKGRKIFRVTKPSKKMN